MDRTEKYLFARKKLSKIIKKEIEGVKNFDDLIETVSDFILENFKKKQKRQKSVSRVVEYEVE